MMRTRATRTAVILVSSCALALGGAIAPASATPAKEAANLATLKSTWSTQPIAARRATCQVYGIDRGAVIRTGVATMMASPTARRGMTSAGWTRVLTKYYAWACSGPGHTPR
jgi:hypothetical protein